MLKERDDFPVDAFHRMGYNFPTYLRNNVMQHALYAAIPVRAVRFSAFGFFCFYFTGICDRKDC